MTSKEYVIWLKGFVEACHEYAPTPKQWDVLKDKLAEVDDSIPLGGIISDHNTFRVHEPYPKWQQPHTINPYYIGDIPQVNLPFISTTPNGTGGNPTPLTFTISTMSGSSIINGVTSNGTTSITYGYPSGSSWHYTDVFNKK